MKKNPIMYCIAKIALAFIALVEICIGFYQKVIKHPSFKPYVVMASMFLALGVSLASIIDLQYEEPVVIVEHVVEKGESIWTIADRYWSGDTREAVWMIQHYNHLESEKIYPGQLLQVPVKMSDIDND
jgi:uncharacterized membrane protein